TIRPRRVRSGCARPDADPPKLRHADGASPARLARLFRRSETTMSLSLSIDPAAGKRPSMSERPEARTPRGFIDRRARDVVAERAILAAVSGVYERWGFEPLETGAFEYADAL